MRFGIDTSPRFAALAAVLLTMAFAMTGCAAPAATEAIPMMMSAGQTAAIAGVSSRSKDPESDPPDWAKDEESMKCQQLVKAPPDVEEIRRAADLSIQSRELRLARSAQGTVWTVHRAAGSDAEGWRSQSGLDRLHFTPALQDLLTDEKPRYLAYSPAIARGPEDSEVSMTLAEDFGGPIGSFEWRDTRYSYAAVKELPCYPGPDKK